MKKILKVDPRIRAKVGELIESPVIVRVTKFNDEGAKEFCENMEKAHHTGQPVIPIVIDSWGGSVYSCLEMIGQMQQADLPVVTIVESKAMSVGAIMFSMGNQRYMAENATLMLHDASMFAFGKTEEIKSDAKEIERLNNLIFRLIAKNTGQKPDYFLELIHHKGHADWYLPAKEAKKHKLCTQIGVPQLVTEVTVNYQFG